MAIRIKSECVHQKAKELAAMTGETQVAAIKRALEEKLAEIRLNRIKAGVDPQWKEVSVSEKPRHE